MDASWPMAMNGYSTGWPPIHVRIKRLATRIHMKHWLIGRNIILRWFDKCRVGKSNKIRIEEISANTPPSLFGIDRRMAYAKRKYHSGLM